MHAAFLRPGLAILFLWAAFAISWLAAAFWSGQARSRAGIGAEIGYRIVLIVGGIVFFVPAHGYHGPLRLWMPSLAGAWVCVGFIALGFAFCWWARIHLGTLWSGNVTVKDNHHVVDSGPYGMVRHPIYTGILIATLATMAVKGTVLGIAGAVLIVAGIWMKARLEERFLREQLGAAAYDEYSRRVPMLIPFARV